MKKLKSFTIKITTLNTIWVINTFDAEIGELWIASTLRHLNENSLTDYFYTQQAPRVEWSTYEIDVPE